MILNYIFCFFLPSLKDKKNQPALHHIPQSPQAHAKPKLAGRAAILPTRFTYIITKRKNNNSTITNQHSSISLKREMD